MFLKKTKSQVRLVLPNSQWRAIPPTTRQTILAHTFHVRYAPLWVTLWVRRSQWAQVFNLVPQLQRYPHKQAKRS